jgi:hypothetical protein
MIALTFAVSMSSCRTQWNPFGDDQFDVSEKDMANVIELLDQVTFPAELTDLLQRIRLPGQYYAGRYETIADGDYHWWILNDSHPEYEFWFKFKDHDSELNATRVPIYGMKIIKKMQESQPTSAGDSSTRAARVSEPPEK